MCVILHLTGLQDSPFHIRFTPFVLPLAGGERGECTLCNNFHPATLLPPLERPRKLATHTHTDTQTSTHKIHTERWTNFVAPNFHCCMLVLLKGFLHATHDDDDSRARFFTHTRICTKHQQRRLRNSLHSSPVCPPTAAGSSHFRQQQQPFVFALCCSPLCAQITHTIAHAHTHTQQTSDRFVPDVFAVSTATEAFVRLFPVQVWFGSEQTFVCYGARTQPEDVSLCSCS